MTYTPGPWRLIWHGNENYPYPLSILAGNTASEHWITRDGQVSSKDNAALIAAAPDLLEALKACLAHGLDEGEAITHDYHSVGAPSRMEKQAGKIEDQGQAAIRKAEGKD